MMNNDAINIIHDKEIKVEFEKNALACRENLLVVSAFVKLDILKWIDQRINESCKKEILVRFRKSDILSGATDFEIIKYCTENNWDIKFDLKLHSKIYVFDKSTFMIGSANATSKGLSFIENANKETVVLSKLSEKDYLVINSIFQDANNFTDIIYREMLENLADIVSEEKNEWNKKIIDEISYQEVKVLFKEDLLKSQSPSSISYEDYSLLGLNVDSKANFSSEIITKCFLQSRIYLWLKRVLQAEPDQTIYFGRLSSILHDEILLNDSIYRVDIKNTLSNLLNWIEELEIKEILVDRPNYSQRIRLKA